MSLPKRVSLYPDYPFFLIKPSTYSILVFCAMSYAKLIACLKTNTRQKLSRQVLMNHLFIASSRYHLGSSRFFYGIRVAHLFSLSYYFVYFVCLSTMYSFTKSIVYIIP